MANKFLLRYSQAEKRYDLHELLRQYGVEKLAAQTVTEAKVRTAHSRYYCALLRGQEEPLLGPEVAKLLGAFQTQLGYLAEAEESHRQCLTLAREMNLEWMVNSILSGLGYTLIWNGKFAEGIDYLLERINKRAFDRGPAHLAFTHNGLSLAYLHQGQYDQARTHSEQSLSAARKAKHPQYIASAL